MRPEFYFEFKFYVTRSGRDHRIGVDVVSLSEGDFALFARWGGSFRRLPLKLAEKIEREQDVLTRAHDEYRDQLYSHRAEAAGF